MAVFTKLSEIEINRYLEFYNIGKLDNHDEIIDGIENTNYKIICNGKPYVLTVFEKRVKEEDLPFFINLKLFLTLNKFKCPTPIKNKEGNIINSIQDKKAVIISFIEGKKLNLANKNECYQVGKMIGDLHDLTKNFNMKRKNSLGISDLKNIVIKCEKKQDNKFKDIIKNLENELTYLENSWPKKLPSGVIHADLFKDNIFFKDGKITGVIDFYFSCNHFYLYDICIAVNDWCFEDNGKVFKNNFFNELLSGYNSIRKLNDKELKSFNMLLRVAAVRILVTRLHDFIYHPKDAIVIKKDPFQYYNILKWHQKNNLLEK